MFPVLIGMCGRSGSGKTYAADMFARYGIVSLDLDAVYRTITAAPGKSDCMAELENAFGSSVRCADGSLDRAHLSSVVFGDETGGKLALLNKITHRHILAEADRICEKLGDEGKRFVILDAPTLFESGADRKCACTFCVVSDDATRIARICSRDGITEAKAKARLDAQMSDSELIDRCDFVVPNYDCAADTERAVRYIVNSLRLEYGL